MVVVLPAPFGPRNPKTSPVATSRSMPRRPRPRRTASGGRAWIAEATHRRRHVTGGSPSTVGPMRNGRKRTSRQWSGSRALPALVGIGLYAIAAAGCSSGKGSSSATPLSSSTARLPTTTLPAGRASPVDWAPLRNPILQSVDHAVKDAALVAVDGQWVSAFSALDGHGTWRIGIEHSANLETWSSMTFLPHDPAVEGEASPDVVRAPDGTFVITYQSFVHDVQGGPRSSTTGLPPTLVHFSRDDLLLRPLFRGHRIA